MRASRFIPNSLVGLLFFPAGVGLFIQVFTADTLPERVIALALGLFCPELARMAVVDLDNIAAISEHHHLQEAPQSSAEHPTEDSRLRHFHRVTVSTIVLEVIGFYAALFSLPLGAAIVIFSQLWFNLLAGIQLWPNQNPEITSLGIAERGAVLSANALGLALLSCWSISSAQVWLGSGLLILIVLFLVIKYAIPGLQPSHPE